MSTAELREKLAERFWTIDPRRWPHKPDLILVGFARTCVGKADGLTYGDLAEECLRQMAWARAVEQQAYDLAAGPTNSVSIAPEDWKLEDLP